MEQIPVSEAIKRHLISGISPSVLPENASDAKLSSARQMCRDGNPFPLIAIQWPHLIINDPKEAKYFKGELGSELNPCLRMDGWQRMIALAFFDKTIREIYIKGCTGAGKGGVVAMCCNLLYDCLDTLKLFFTGPSFSDTHDGIFGETTKWRALMRYPAPANDNSTMIASSQQHFMKIKTPPRGKLGETFSGKHSEKETFYVFDEATSSEDTWIENAEKNAFKIIALANPRTILGAFRNAFKPLGDKENKSGVCMGRLGKRLCVTIGGMDCLNVKEGRLKNDAAPLGGIEINGTFYPEGEAIRPEDYEYVKPLIPGQMDVTQFRAACANREPVRVRCFAHGMFPDEDPEAQVILSSWLDRHHAHWHTLDKGSNVPVNAFGLDVAHSLEGDHSSAAAGSSAGCAGIKSVQFNNYPAIAAWLLDYASSEYEIDLKQGIVPVCIDYGGGYGAGVGDWLEACGVWVIRSVPAGRAEVMPEVYTNMRTEMWSLLGRRLNPADPCGADPWAIPDDCTGLVEDMLHALRKWNADMTRHGLVSKLEVKQSLGRSPDKGDSLALLFQAVRTMEGLDEWFRATSGDLLVYPAEANKGTKPPANPRNVNQQIADVLEWARRRNT